MRNIMNFFRCSCLIMILAVFATVLDAAGSSGTPPVAPIRNAAEFEPNQAVMIRYPHGIPMSLIKEIAEDAEVLTLVRDSAEEAVVENLYLLEGVNLGNCTYLHAQTDTHWTRDYGPWFLFDGNGVMGIADNDNPFPDPNDDIIPLLYGLNQGIPVYETGFKNEGGNWMTDGHGTAISMNWVYECNPGLTYQKIHDIAHDFLGIENYHVLKDPKAWYHVDCMAKYLSPDTIMVAEVPVGHVVYEDLEAKAVYFANQVSCYGTPIKVVRIFSPDQPYTNSLIMNHKVLVPLTGSSWDADAVASYEAAMPGYEVHGILYNKWNPYDALHCRTKEITDRQMLYIHHTPILDRPAGAQGFPVEAEIIAYSGQPFTSGTPEVRWSTGSAWNPVAMTHTGGDQYLANIPWQPEGTLVKYYVHAADGSGRSENHPYIGEPDAHTFTVNTLGIDRNALSAEKGGKIRFFLNAGPDKAGRHYFILGSVSGTAPGHPLPGGLVLPLNWDAFTDLTLLLANGPYMLDFHGQLDASGTTTSLLDTQGKLPRIMEGVTLFFSGLLYSPFDFVSNAVEIKVLQ